MKMLGISLQASDLTIVQAGVVYDKLQWKIGRLHNKVYIEEKQHLKNQYRGLIQELYQLEEEHRRYQTEHSWADRIRLEKGEVEIPDEHEKVEHKAPMLSLKDVFETEEVYDFHEKVQNVGNNNDRQGTEPLERLGWAVILEVMYQEDKENGVNQAQFGRTPYASFIVGRIQDEVERK